MRESLDRPFCCLNLPQVPLFTPEIARLNAYKSAEVRRANAEARRNGTPPQAAHDAAYVAARVRQVRKQIDAINRRIEAEDDPQRLDRLVLAVYRLTELERVLSGRPLPGQLKPIAQRQVRPEAEPIR